MKIKHYNWQRGWVKREVVLSELAYPALAEDVISCRTRPFAPRFAHFQVSRPIPPSWTGPLNFQQIYDDLVHYVTNFMKRRGFHRTNYLPDCIQHGFMALWLELGGHAITETGLILMYIK
jgi:hypothetical protein